MRLVRWVVLLAVAAVLVGGYGLVAPFGPAREIFVEIPPGTSSAGMASRLRAAGAIRWEWPFLLERKLKGGRLQAGEYMFAGPETVGLVYSRIRRGDVYTIGLTIPEGYNIFDVAQAVQTAGLGDAAEFLAAERADTRLIADLEPGAASLEGYLFPETYHFSRHATPEQMLAAMVHQFRRVGVQLGLLTGGKGGGRQAAGIDVARVVTLASLIEKEVAVAGERPLVAGVFENRLRLGMPLATDPTVIYAALLNDRWRGVIHQSDLAYDSPYNTYRHAGLPPGPIANPGVAALTAAMHPASTEYLYFVADAQGHSVFSRDLKEHTAQVAAYRAAEKKGQVR